jgi:EAL domain-containing protein (putative c-di-GMP-specific phosphodiesterase class I)
MYRAKNIGKGCYQTYDVEMDENTARRYRMEVLLRTAIEKDELFLHFQPQMNIQTGLFESVEVFLRWNSDEMGLLQPTEFIPLAEETGLIVPLGEWVLRTACLRAKEWIEAGVPLMRVAVNISVIEFMQADFIKMVTEAVNDSGLDPSFVELEITESVLVEDTFSAVNTLQTLKDLGFLLSIDDFGTGFSSLSQLKHFPIDRLKIDESFVQGMLTNMHDAAIIKAVLTMADSMNLKVIAEGVETIEQLEYLNKIQCDEAQGFLLSRPVPPAAITELFLEFNSSLLKRTGTE